MVYKRNIAHIGLLSPIKGIDVFYKLSKEIDAHWFIIGSTEEYREYDWSHVTITGFYHSLEELADLIDLHEIDFECPCVGMFSCH